MGSTQPPSLDDLPPGLRSLRAFEQAHTCAVAACTAAARLSGGESSVLADQIRRASISVYANVAEGHAKSSRMEQARYYDIALASLAEVQAHVAHAVARQLIDRSDGAAVQRSAQRANLLLTGLRRRARALAAEGK